MKKSLRTAGIVVLAAGVLTYPAIRLFKYMAKKRAEGRESDDMGREDHVQKHFARAYRGKNKPHHRHAENGHLHHEA